MTDAYGRDPRLKDFRTFLYLCWRSLGLPEPTRLQYDIAHFLQIGPDRICVQAFRGIGKSWITAAYVCWRLYWNPDLKILIVSQAKDHADLISTFILQMIHTVPGLGFLSPEGRERYSKVAFDVGPAKPHKQPSVTSKGITGAMTGARADIVLADDVESLNNSLTQAGRDLLAYLVREFEAILSPGGKIIFLGTPQSDQSLYRGFPERGYIVRTWPALYPDQRLRAVQAGIMSPLIESDLMTDPTLEGQPTDPKRFGTLELEARRLSYGPAGFALQFMLDTSPSDALRYPLKLRDLSVMSIHPDLAPEDLVWSNMEPQWLRDLPSPGMGGDRFYTPIIPSETKWTPYRGGLLYVDPAGTGTDETAYTITKESHGRIFVPECMGLQGGYTDSVMVTLATRAKVNKVQLIQVESNFGDGMFEKLLAPHVNRIYPCPIESIKVTTQKERRIIDTLEPVMNQHRLILDRRVVENDGYRDATVDPEIGAKYRLFYQMTRLTRDRGSLLKDDRVDSLAGAVAYWLESMAKDVQHSVEQGRAGRRDLELKEFMDGLLGRPRSRGQKSWLNGNAATRTDTVRPKVTRGNTRRPS